MQLQFIVGAGLTGLKVEAQCDSDRTRGGATGGGGGGGDRPLKVSKKIKYGVFSCIKISFSVIFKKEIHALRGLLSRF